MDVVDNVELGRRVHGSDPIPEPILEAVEPQNPKALADGAVDDEALVGCELVDGTEDLLQLGVIGEVPVANDDERTTRAQYLVGVDKHRPCDVITNGPVVVKRRVHHDEVGRRIVDDLHHAIGVVRPTGDPWAHLIDRRPSLFGGIDGERRIVDGDYLNRTCLLYTSPSPRDS